MSLSVKKPCPLSKLKSNEHVKIELDMSELYLAWILL